jgi:hypothetical protein
MPYRPPPAFFVENVPILTGFEANSNHRGGRQEANLLNGLFVQSRTDRKMTSETADSQSSSL